MNNVRKFGWMPEEIYSKKGKTADDGSLAKVLFYDIVRQARVSAGLSSIDAANCYDSISRALASFVFQAFGVPEEAIQSMLTAIEEMKYFLRTAYGDSKDFAGSRQQYLNQISRVVSREWGRSCWIGSHQHHHITHTQTERSWRALCLSYLQSVWASSGDSFC